MAAIYLHIPFCKTRCIYCDFYSTTRSELKTRYVHTLCRELEMRKEYLKGEPVETIYFGGGTPSQLEEADFKRIFETIRENYGMEHCREITLEANPDDLSQEYLKMLSSLPFNRVSMGIQTFDDTTLQLLKRRHSSQTAVEAVRRCREAGFQNIIMLEGSWVGDKTRESMKVCGYEKLSEMYKVPFKDMQADPGELTECGGMELEICREAKSLDFLINVPVMKGHCQTKITCALKNMKGLLPNREKRHFHAMGLHKPIAHLAVGLHQNFILVDNICGDWDFEDGGNPVEMNRLIAGRDPVLVDAFVCHEMGYGVEEVPYIRMAEALGAGCADWTQARIRELNPPVSQVVKTGRRKVVEVADAVEEVESCSACYGYLIPALDRLKEEGILEKLNTKICIGQGYRGKTGTLGIGSCTRGFASCLQGCPPTDEEIYQFLKKCIQEKEERI